MILFLSLLSIIGYASRINFLRNKKFDTSIPFTISVLIIALFLSGYFEILRVASKIILFFGVSLFFWTCYEFLIQKKNDRNLKNQFCFIFLCLLFWMLTRTEYYSFFNGADNFSHWARASMIIIENDRLFIGSDPIYFPDYPPGTALYNYYFFIFQPLSNNNLMFAQGTISIALLTPFFNIISQSFKSKFVIRSILYIFLISILYSFQQGLHTLTADIVLALFFGVAISGYFYNRYESNTIVSIISIAPIALVIILIKPIGMFFFLTIILVIFSDIFFKRKDFYFFKQSILLFMIFLIGICLNFFWGDFKKNNQLDRTFKNPISSQSISSIISAFNPNTSTKLQKLTISNYVDRIASPLKYYKTSIWFFVTLFYLIILFKFNAKLLYKDVIPIMTLFAGFIFYQFILLLLYLFSFGSYEGPLLASIDRYSMTYYIGILLLLFSLFIYRINFLNNDSKNYYVVIIFVVVISILPNINSARKDILKSFFSSSFFINQSYIQDSSNLINLEVGFEKKIFYVWQESYGVEKMQFNYEIYPNQSNSNCWSIGKYQSLSKSGDHWSCDLNSSEFRDLISEYDYIFLAKVDQLFKTKLSILFSDKLIEDGNLYKVINSNNNISMKFVNNFKKN